MSIVSSAQALAKLEPYLLLAKSARGAAASKLISEATAASGCYVFSELLDFDGIQALAKDSQYSASYRLLEIFAYGTLQDYHSASASSASLPALNAAQLEKLRHLTLITLASQSRNLSYATLAEVLGLSSNEQQQQQQHQQQQQQSAGPSASVAQYRVNSRCQRQLEDIIIDAIYAGIISARLDQQRQRVDVESVMGRDVRGDEGVAHLSTSLHDWANSTSSLLSSLAERIEAIRSNDADNIRTRAAHDEAMERSLQYLADLPPGAHGGSGNHAAGFANARAQYDRLGSDRYGAEMEAEDEAGALRKKKSSAAGPVRSKRSRA